MKFDRILVPLDFSEHSLAAVKAAAALAEKVSGSLIFLHVLPPMVITQGEMLPLVIPPDPHIREKLELEIAEVKSRFAPDIPGECVVHDGQPWPGICEVAEKQKVDLIVVASHGYTGLKRMLLGSTAEQVVRHATCPVMVVKNFID